MPALFVSKAGKPMVVATLTKIGINGDDEFLLIIKDLQTDKILSQKELNSNNHINYKRVFTDRSIYMIPEDKTSLFKIDTESCELIDVTDGGDEQRCDIVRGCNTRSYVH